jgi:branched-chain amino acid transport system ATP-binding protein
MLKLVDLGGGYGPIRVIDKLSLEVSAGETVALLGPNGAGKSTLMAAIAGVLRGQTGQVWLESRNLSKAPAHARVRAGIVLVPEGRRVFAPLRVYDNLRLGALRLASWHRLSERLDYVFELFPRLKERREQLAGTLSGGEQQMLAVGRALMCHPRVLLLDEPFLGLAPLIVEEICQVLRGLSKSGLTVLLVEQKVDIALDLSQRTYVLLKGRIVRTGASQEIKARGNLKETYFSQARET